MSRRRFLKQCVQGLSTVSLTSSLAQILSTPLFAQQSTDYKALVCLFLDGGMDCNSAVIPMDSHYAQYAANRPDLAYAQAVLNPLKTTTNQRSFGLNPDLRNMASLLNNEEVAILAIVGTSARPTAKADVGYAGELPTNLFQHDKQIGAWETALAKTVSSTGWAGRVADAILSGNGSGKMPAVVSTSGYHLVGQGQNTDQITASDGDNAIALVNTVHNLQQYFIAAEQTDIFNNLQKYLADQQLRTLSSSKVITDTFAAGAVNTPFPNTGIGQQLQLVAKLIAGHTVHDTKRQIFAVRHGSYDTHTNQFRGLSDRLAPLDAAIASLVAALKEIGMYDKVLIFTCSDFGRSLLQNANGGSDHAWGGHQFIIGGAVKGGAMYGTFPTLELGGPDDINGIGNWIPTTATTQYLAAMATWLGVPATSLPTIFPELPNFSVPTLPLL